jgi:flagellar biosynthesis protein FliR
MELLQLSQITLFTLIVLVCRIGAALMLFSGIGENYVPIRVRLQLALALAIILLPLLSGKLPPPPQGALSLALVVVSEVIVGLFLGGLVRMLQAILHVAGMLIAFQSSLASAMMFDANQGSQGSVFGNFLTLIGVAMIFASNLHHVMLTGIAASYEWMPVAGTLPISDMAEAATHTLADGFSTAFMIASPLMLIGMLFFLASGILARLMPSMQVFTVLMPAQIIVSFLIFTSTLSAAMLWYIEHYRDALNIIFISEKP